MELDHEILAHRAAWERRPPTVGELAAASIDSLRRRGEPLPDRECQRCGGGGVGEGAGTESRLESWVLLTTSCTNSCFVIACATVGIIAAPPKLNAATRVMMVERVLLSISCASSVGGVA
jgi:hypothetical protein